MTHPSQNNNEPLTQRGLEQVIAKAKWELGVSGEFYFVPVFLFSGERIHLEETSLSSDHSQPVYWSAKYNISATARGQFGKVNLSGKPSHVHYYFLRDIQHAIKESNGCIYLASGLTDLLSYHAAGLPNVIAPLGGEMAIPQSFASDMKMMGITDIIYLPDNDATGQKSATKVAALLAGSSINYRPRTLHPQWKDINELWQSCIQFGETVAIGLFQTTVKESPGMKIKLPATSAARAAPRKKSPPDFDSEAVLKRGWRISDSARYAIYNALGVTGFDSNGKCQVSCPFHDDAHPSAVLFENQASRLPTLHCSACGVTYLFKDLCKHFEITDFKEWLGGVGGNHRQPTLEPTKIGVNEAKDTVYEGLPTELRKALLQRKSDGLRLARFFDILLKCDVNVGQVHTAKDIFEQTKKFLTHGTIRNTLAYFCTQSALSLDTENPVFSLVSDNNRAETVQNLDDCLDASLEPSLESSPVGRGRAPNGYYIPSVPELAAYLGVSDLRSTEAFPDEALQGKKAYRQCAYEIYVRDNYAIWKRENNFPSTQQLASIFGISKRSIHLYDKEIERIKKLRRWESKYVHEGYELSSEERGRGMRLYINTSGKSMLMRPLPSERWHDDRRFKIGEYVPFCNHCYEPPRIIAEDGCPPPICEHCGREYPWEFILVRRVEDGSESSGFMTDPADNDVVLSQVDVTGELSVAEIRAQIFRLDKPALPLETSSENALSVDNLNKTITNSDGEIVVLGETPENAPANNVFGIPKMWCKHCGQSTMGNFGGLPAVCDFCKAPSPWQEYPPYSEEAEQDLIDFGVSLGGILRDVPSWPAVALYGKPKFLWRLSDFHAFVEDCAAHLQSENPKIQAIKTLLLQEKWMEESLEKIRIGYTPYLAYFIRGGVIVDIPEGIIIPVYKTIGKKNTDAINDEMRIHSLGVWQVKDGKIVKKSTLKLPRKLGN